MLNFVSPVIFKCMHETDTLIILSFLWGEKIKIIVHFFWTFNFEIIEDL